MTDSHNYNEKTFRLYDVQDAIVSYSDAIQALSILQLPRSWRVGIISKGQNALVDLSQDLLGKRLGGRLVAGVTSIQY